MTSVRLNGYRARLNYVVQYFDSDINTLLRPLDDIIDINFDSAFRWIIRFEISQGGRPIASDSELGLVFSMSKPYEVDLRGVTV